MPTAWNVLEKLVPESDDDLDDAELDALTSPQKSFANPFEPAARTTAKINQPATKMSTTTKPQMTAPSPKNDFGQPVSPNVARSISKQKPTSSFSSPSKPLAKPSYSGKFIGQQFNSAGKAPGSRQSTVSLTWDGNDWIPNDQFDTKARSGQLGKKEGLTNTFGLGESFGPTPPETPRSPKERKLVPLTMGMRWFWDRGEPAPEETIKAIANVMGIRTEAQPEFVNLWREGEKKQEELSRV